MKGREEGGSCFSATLQSTVDNARHPIAHSNGAGPVRPFVRPAAGLKGQGKCSSNLYVVAPGVVVVVRIPRQTRHVMCIDWLDVNYSNSCFRYHGSGHASDVSGGLKSPRAFLGDSSQVEMCH